MPPREDIALFIDLETTGSDKEKDEVIEIGIVALDMQSDGYPEIGSFSAVFLPSDAAFVRMMDKKVVREMHEKNGLLQVILENRENPDSDFNYRSKMELGRWVDSVLGYTSVDDTHVHWGGSGVMHFDRPFIDKAFPGLSRRLAYYAAYDIGPTRRQFQKAGVGWLPDALDSKTHRALDDARVHADEFRWSQRYIRGEL